MNILKLFDLIGFIDSVEDDMGLSAYYFAYYKGIKLRAIERFYDYAPDNKLICIDRDDCFNKESQCPISFLSEGVDEKDLISDLDFLCTEEGRKASCSEFWGENNKFKLYQKNARLQYYQEIWDVDHYVGQRNRELGIDFYRDFPYLDWSYLTKVYSAKQLAESNEHFKNEKYEN